MQIKRVRLSGFKSFVDPADFRIEPGLTGIVGPNGCGKSNLLEALRWAMGENSPKSMRGAGMEDVIFAGTATRPARDFAEVSILLDGAADDGGESEVVRRIERGAGSAYRIDGRDVRARDVALLFADAATGAHSPALVSQGRIGAVIAARPADRRAMLEEAAGIAGLHVRRKDAEQKLRATEANLERLDELIADQDARAGALRRQARQAERYRALTERIRIAEARLIYARWRDAAAAADAARREAQTAEAEVQGTAEAQRAAAAYQTQAAEQLAERRAAALAARDMASEAAHRLAAIEAERAQVERRIAELADTARRILADREREGGLAGDAATAIARLTEETGTLDARIADAVEKLPALDAALADAERIDRDVEVALAQALAAQAGEAAEIRVADAAIAVARERLFRADREGQVLAARRAALAESDHAEERDAAAREGAVAGAARQGAEADLAGARSDEAAARSTAEQAHASRAAVRADLAALDGEIAALERANRATVGDRLLDMLSVYTGYERALAAALGDDADAGLDPQADRHWAGAAPLPADPVGPAGATPLGRYVRAPAALARRLAQIFVVDRDGGEPLAVGQRLVTRDGRLRRWDGFITTGEGAAAAERLQRVNRLAALREARPPALDTLDENERIAAEADRAIADTGARIATARVHLAEAERAEREARQKEDRATASLERIATQSADLDTALERTAADRDEAQAALDVAVAARALVSDGAETAQRVAELQRAAEARRGATAQARADRFAMDRAIAADRERAAAARAEGKGWHARAGEAARRIVDMDKRAALVATEVDTLTGRPAALDAQLSAARVGSDERRGDVEQALAAEREAEAGLRNAEEAARSAGEAFATAREARAGAVARADNQELRRVEMGRLAGERFECPAPMLPEKIGFASGEVGQAADESAAHERLVLERERIGPVNLVAEQELAELEDGALGNAAEREELGQAVARLRGSIGTLNREGRQRLLAAFEAVNGHFARLFKTLFDGGQAHLELVDSDDPLDAGLEIMAQPPGKRLQSLTLLSGGEQALTAVALIFGLFLTNPAPICVLDEVDAPLDDANIERFCDLLDRMTGETDTRYLIVTHNAVTMSRMHRLFGVTMIEKGVSRLVSVDLGGAETLLAAE